MPFKDKLKQLLYMRKYQAKRRAERKKQEQLQEAHVQAVKIMREHLVGRTCMPAKLVPQDVKDLCVNFLSIPEVGFPILHKDFVLGNFETLRKATLAMVEAEDKLLLVGEHTGWPAMGIHGLATIPEHGVIQSKGKWSRHFLTDIHRAIKTLESAKHFEPPILIMNTLASTIVPKFLPGMYQYSPFLCNSKGEENNALLVAPHETNFRVLIAHDLDISSPQRSDNKAKLWEALTPVIYKPSSICEITNIKYS